MTQPALTITRETQRRFILGKQGLWPGRRWQAKAGVAQALAEGVQVQIDPLNIIARSHDLTLHSRVLDYSPELLEQVMYTERAFFDYGGVVRVRPMHALPCWRVSMARVAARHIHLGERNQGAIEEVLAALRERGPLSNRDFASEPGEKKYWHAAKATAQALYYLWLKGEVMTHSRKGFDRRFDLAERIVPPAYDRVASVEEAENYFAGWALRELNLADLRSWRASFMGLADRKITQDEAAERLEGLVQAGQVVRVRLEEGGKDPIRYLPADDLALLEEVQAGRIPTAWQPLGPTTEEEAVFLAPLDNISARGRALPLFGFEYVWEVYKPANLRRWGYYVLPVLHGDRLVARFDSALDRRERVLRVIGLWLEDGVSPNGTLLPALQAGFRRFAKFAGFERLSAEPGPGQEIVKQLEF